MAQHRVVQRRPPHSLNELPFGDFLALSEMFKLRRKLVDLFADLGVINRGRPSSQCMCPCAQFLGRSHPILLLCGVTAILGFGCLESTLTYDT